MISSPTTLLPLLLLLGTAGRADATRVVAFKFLEGSGTCSSGVEWDIELGEFHVDCGNANHGCTRGHSIMIYGDFASNKYFSSVADVDIKACEFGSLLCTPNFVESDFNVCQDLKLEDTQGNQICNEAGSYTFERSYILPNNHTWWEDFAFEGLKFNIVVTLDEDMECSGTFVTRVYYEYEPWMSWTIGSVAVATGLFLYIRRMRAEKNKGKINLAVEEAKAEDALTQPQADKKQKKSKKKIPNGVKTTPVIASVRTSEDEESVTTTAYLRMLDFSPEGLSHADRMEQVRQAHFERLRKTRDSRRVTSPVTLS